LIKRKATGIRDEAGQMLILTALLMTALLFAVGIAFDLGTLFVSKRTLQEAVDAAAFAGAVAIYNGAAAGTAVTDPAKADFALNGFSLTDPMLMGTPQFNSPPSAGNAKVGDNSYIEVVVTINVRVPLLPAQGGLLPVTSRSTAGAVRQTSNYAIVTLNTTAAQSFWLWAAGTVNINNGNVQVNSSCNGCSSGRSGADKSGGTFTLAPGLTAKAVGGASGFSAGQWTTGAPLVPDPLSGFLRPLKTGLPGNAAQTLGSTSSSTTVNLVPGYWTGLLTLQGPGGGGCPSGITTVNFAPGTYIFQAGLNVPSFQCVNLSGTGVMMFNTQANYPTETGGCGGINLAGNGSYNISAPTSGYYFGMHIFQDPTCNNLAYIFMSGTISTSNGSIYAPAATVWLGAGSTLTIGGHVIVDSLKFISGGIVNFNYDPTTAANALLPALVN
jgi:Flp pilus assembly protein TadG